jgi:hypothetical protein
MGSPPSRRRAAHAQVGIEPLGLTLPESYGRSQWDATSEPLATLFGGSCRSDGEDACETVSPTVAVDMAFEALRWPHAFLISRDVVTCA